MKRLINLDWLEVYCLEDTNRFPCNAEYFIKQGYEVKQRAYGTPQYREVFTVFDRGHFALEIRRNPYSTRDNGGIFDFNSVHIRLTNGACYEVNPIEKLRAFLCAHGYFYKAISRIDIALDFQQFDDGSSVQDFISSYMRGEFSKVNQNRLHAHGADEFSGRVMNSLKWGAASSPNTTKLYNKTLEMKECGDKPYIVSRWTEAGFDLSRPVWRLEFSMNSQFQNLKNIRNGEIMKKDLSSYDTPLRLFQQFIIMYRKYFDFRRVEIDSKGHYKRKYDCMRVALFDFKLSEDLPYVPCRPPKQDAQPGRTTKTLIKKLETISVDTTIDAATRKAACVLISYFIYNSEFDINFTRYRKWPMLDFVEEVKKSLDSELASRVRSWSDLNPILFPYSTTIEKVQQCKQRDEALEEWEQILFGDLSRYGVTDTAPF